MNVFILANSMLCLLCETDIFDNNKVKNASSMQAAFGNICLNLVTKPSRVQQQLATLAIISHCLAAAAAARNSVSAGNVLYSCVCGELRCCTAASQCHSWQPDRQRLGNSSTTPTTTTTTTSLLGSRIAEHSLRYCAYLIGEETTMQAHAQFGFTNSTPSRRHF